MGYIGQMPQAPDALPGRETSTGEPPRPGGARADELPSLVAGGSRTISLSVPPTPSATDEDAPE